MILDQQVALAEGARQAAEHSRDKAEQGRLVAQGRVRLLESVLADVWRWKRGDVLDPEMLTSILERADREYSLLSELEKVEEVLEARRRIEVKMQLTRRRKR